MQGASLITVELHVADGDNKALALGGPTEQAEALADHLGLTAPPAGKMLKIKVPASAMPPILDWIRQNHPQIMAASLDDPAVQKWRAAAEASDSIVN